MRPPAHDPRGEAAQDAVREWLKRSGYWVVPLHAIEEGRGAPALIGLIRRHVLPDFQACRDGRTCWVEVKYKDSPVKYQIAGGEYRHGVDLPNWDAYLEVERESGVPGWLAIIQARAGKAPELSFDPMLLVAPFTYLAKWAQRAPEPTPKAARGMVYWPVDAFEPHRIDLAQPLVLGAKTTHEWDRVGRDGTAPRWAPSRQGLLWPRPSFPCRTKPQP
jgi:hypothetical protein